MIKAVVDRDSCVGCGLCSEICPDVFKMQEDKAVSKVDKVPEGAEESCRDAAQQCPVEAITVSDDA